MILRELALYYCPAHCIVCPKCIQLFTFSLSKYTFLLSILLPSQSRLNQSLLITPAKTVWPLAGQYWCWLGSSLNNNNIGKYQPSGAGGTRSPPATPHRLQRRTAYNTAPPASGPQNGRRGLERCLPLGFGALPSTFAK